MEVTLNRIFLFFCFFFAERAFGARTGSKRCFTPYLLLCASDPWVQKDGTENGVDGVTGRGG